MNNHSIVGFLLPHSVLANNVNLDAKASAPSASGDIGKHVGARP